MRGAIGSRNAHNRAHRREIKHVRARGRRVSKEGKAEGREVEREGRQKAIAHFFIGSIKRARGYFSLSLPMFTFLVTQLHSSPGCARKCNRCNISPPSLSGIRGWSQNLREGLHGLQYEVQGLRVQGQGLCFEGWESSWRHSVRERHN